MKIGHAVTLALVAWYLLLPPLEVHRLNQKAPLSLWDNVGTYETAAACKEQAAKLKQQHAKLTDPIMKEHFTLGQCVASDDPRLKGK